MIFCARRFTAKEAVEIGLINKCVAPKDLLKETLAWCETIKGHSPQTLRMTKKSSTSSLTISTHPGSTAWSCSRMSGLGGKPRRHGRVPGGPQTRLPEIPHAQ